MFWDGTFARSRMGWVQTGVLDHQDLKPGTARDRKKEKEPSKVRINPKRAAFRRQMAGDTCRRLTLRLRVTAQSF